MKAKRISLVEGFAKEISEPSMDLMQQFVKTGNVVAKTEERHEVEFVEPLAPIKKSAPKLVRSESSERAKPPAPKHRPSRIHPVALVPVTIRLQPELAGALKRASLERQLSGGAVFTQQDIVEEALTPWLKKAGFL